MPVSDLRVRAQGVVGKGGDVVVEGKADAGSEIEIENQSLAPYAPTNTPDVFARAKAGPDGKFAVVVPAGREGDRVTVRSTAGGAGAAVALRLSNVEAVDERPPVIRQQGLHLVADENGFTFANACKTDVVGEPGQIVRVENLHTHAVVDFTLDAKGRMPAGARVHGSPGHRFRLGTTDGTHDTAMTSTSGYLLAPVPGMTEGKVEPPTANGASDKMVRLHGPLFADRLPARGSVKQGQLGDCWFVSAVDAIVARDPRIIRDMMHDNGDGTTTVTFQRFDHEQKRYVPERVTVTNQVYAAGWTNVPTYGSSSDGNWFALLEKAYAAWKGGYDGAKSGYPFEAFEAITGVEGRHYDLDVTSADALWSAMMKRPNDAMVGWTKVDSREVPFANTGLVSDHGYAFFGGEVVGGQRFVRIRNPWGSNPYPANTGALGMKDFRGGELLVPLDVIAKMFVGVGFASVA